MRKIISITHVSLDGVMQAPGGPQEDPSNGFSHGGWSMSLGDEALLQAINEIMAGEFDMILGRKTYDIFASYWPHQDGENSIAKAFNKATKYVATHSLNQLDWQNSQIIGGDVVESLRQLKAPDGPEFHIWGSSNLMQTLIANDLIDEYRLWIYPVVLGKGKRLFENSVPPLSLSLVNTQTTPKGILINTYKPTGKLSAAI